MTATQTNPMRFQFQVSGQAMSMMEGSELMLDPVKYDGGTIGAHHAYSALIHAPGRRCGKGWTYTVDVTRLGAEVIEDYCRTVGDGLTGDGDPENHSDGRALLVVADRIKALL
jgi:hypothetical protein